MGDPTPENPVALREAMIAALREAMLVPGFGYIDFTIRDERADEELAWIVDAILPALIDAAPRAATEPIERALRSELRTAVEALEGRCHDREGLGCETIPCVENVRRADVIALLAAPAAVVTAVAAPDAHRE